MSTSQFQASRSRARTSALNPIEDRQTTGRIENVFFILWLLLALAAPWWTKAAVLIFRILAILWIIGLCARVIKPRKTALTLPILAFIFWTALSSASSYAPTASWGRMRGIAMALMAVILPQTISQVKRLQWITAALILSSTAIALFTSWQYAFGVGVRITQVTPALVALGLQRDDVIHSVNGQRCDTVPQALGDMTAQPSSEGLRLELWHGAPLEHRLVYVTFAELSAAGLKTEMLQGHARPDRAQGMFSQYVAFAEFLMIVAALALGIAIVANASLRIWLLVAFGVICGALVLTETRATWISLLLGSTAAFWISSGKRSRVWIAVLCVAALGASFLILQHARRLNSVEHDPGTEYRLLMWKDGMRLIREHPIFGVGMDSIFSHASEWHLEAYQRFPNLKSHFHSTYIQVAVENGIPALAIWLWILWTFAKHCFGLRRRAEQASFRGAGLAGLAMITAFALGETVHYTLGDSEVMLVFWFLMGLLLGYESVLQTTLTQA